MAQITRARTHLSSIGDQPTERMSKMGFVIAFPGSAAKRRPNSEAKRPATAEIMIFPGVRYERYAEAPKRAKPKPVRRYFDTMPQPG
jgi:hypothetical protein